MTPYRLMGLKIGLRALSPKDAEGEYYIWLQQSDVISALSSQYYPISRDGLAKYIAANLDQDGIAFLGICRLEDGVLVGTVRLAVMDKIARVAGIGIMIGDPSARGCGFAREALSLVINYGFDTLNLQKICAGVASSNAPSLALFRSIMSEEGIRKKHVFANGSLQDEHMFAVFRE